MTQRIRRIVGSSRMEKVCGLSTAYAKPQKTYIYRFLDDIRLPIACPALYSLASKSFKGTTVRTFALPSL